VSLNPQSSTPILPGNDARQAILPLAVLGCYWALLIYQLGAQWSVFEQYHYGWSVPFLCLYLLWRRSRTPAAGGRKPEAGDRRNLPSSIFYLPVALLALLYAATRLLHEANPVWRLTSWLWSLEIVGFTLCFVYIAGGLAWLRRFAFPIAFFLVAVPWPSGLENDVVQSLMRLNTGITVELLGLSAVPAIQHGNVIQISNGMVGIDEACSGIRSLQATLMISLFLGEVFRLRARWRVLLVFGGFLAAFGFNVIRTFLLTRVAASKGMAAIASWHDPAGVTILVGCFLCLWLAAWKMRDRNVVKMEGPGAETVSHLPVLRNLALGLGCWLVLVEAGTEFWFRAHEQPKGAALEWSPNWPRRNPSFELADLPPQVRAELLFDQGASGRWRQPDGTQWQVFYLRWLPVRSLYGRVKVSLAKSHNPEVCLQAVGMKMIRELAPVSLDTGKGFSIGFRRYLFDADGQMIHVFFSVEEQMEAGGSPGFLRMTAWGRLRAALAGSRNYGQRTLEIAISGFEREADATAALARELPALIETRK